MKCSSGESDSCGCQTPSKKSVCKIEWTHVCDVLAETIAAHDTATFTAEDTRSVLIRDVYDHMVYCAQPRGFLTQIDFEDIMAIGSFFTSTFCMAGTKSQRGLSCARLPNKRTDSNELAHRVRCSTCLQHSDVVDDTSERSNPVDQG